MGLKGREAACCARYRWDLNAVKIGGVVLGALDAADTGAVWLKQLVRRPCKIGCSVLFEEVRARRWVAKMMMVM